MTKVIVLSTVLGLGALGIACGDAAPANNTANKPANTPAPVATVAPATPAATVANTANTANTANKMATPAANAPKANANAKATPKS